MSVPKPILREVLSDQPIPVSGGTVAGGTVAGAGRARAREITAVRIRAWLLTAALLLLPVAAYWPATFHDYGLRDDYSNLREAHEEHRIILQFCASHARPIYGWLLQATYGQTVSVNALHWMRCGAALLLGALSLVMFRALRAVGWSLGSSVCVALLLSLVPSAQVIAGWAVGWPYALAALLAVAGFFTVEGALTAGLSKGPVRATNQWLVALALMVVSALIYQPSTLFYVVPLAAALIAQRRRQGKEAARWLGIHLGFVLSSLGLTYGIMTALYAFGVFVKSGRIAFETHWGEKIAWFLQENLPNALSLLVLNDDHQRNHFLYLAGAAVAGACLIAGLAVEWRRHGRARGIVWAFGLFGLPVVAMSVSMVASEHYATYRTILAMTAVLLCFLVASVRTLTAQCGAPGRRLLAALAVGTAFVCAQQHVYALIAVPQGNEWQIIMAGAKRVNLDSHEHPRIFAIASSPADMSTVSIYHDEFGSLSSNSEWVPKEMFKRAMHDLHPNTPNLESRYDFSEGYKLPENYQVPAREHYDVVIDMRRLRESRTNN